MSDTTWVWIILALYFISMVAVAMVSIGKNKKQVQGKGGGSLSQFVVGGRDAGPWMSAFTYGASYFSAVMFVGYAGRSGWDYALWAVLVGFSNAVLGAFLAWKILAGRTRNVTRRLKIMTMPQLFQKRYDSRGMKIYSALLIFIFMTPYSASVYSGLSYIVQEILGVDYSFAMLAIAVIAAVYLVLGGYLASLLADFIQGIIMLFGVSAMIIAVVNSEKVGGITNGIENIITQMQNSGLTDMNSTQIFNLICMIILTSIGTWGMPQMIHKFYAVASEDAIKKGTVISTVFCIVISMGAYFVGSLARLFFTEIPLLNGAPNKDLIIPRMLMETLPMVLLGVVLILILSASVSTLSGITLTSCSAISMDLISGELLPKMNKKKTLLLTRCLCLIFIAVSYLIASFKTPILTLMSFSWGIIAGAFLPAYVLGLYWKKMNKLGAWAGMITGPVTCLILAIIYQFDPSYASIFGVLAMIASFAACIIVSLATQAKIKSDTGYLKACDNFYNDAFVIED